MSVCGGGMEGAGSSNNNKSLLKQLTPLIGLFKKLQQGEMKLDTEGKDKLTKSS